MKNNFIPYNKELADKITKEGQFLLEQLKQNEKNRTKT